MNKKNNSEIEIIFIEPVYDIVLLVQRKKMHDITSKSYPSKSFTKEEALLPTFRIVNQLLSALTSETIFCQIISTETYENDYRYPGFGQAWTLPALRAHVRSYKVGGSHVRILVPKLRDWFFFRGIIFDPPLHLPPPPPKSALCMQYIQISRNVSNISWQPYSSSDLIDSAPGTA